jgi:hypothetical protein
MLTPGGPGGKYLGRSGPVSHGELREVLADVHDQLRREPEVLDALQQAILEGDLSTSTEIITHLRDLFVLLDWLVRNARVGGKA